MPVPEWGQHAGHLVQHGKCQDCGKYLNRQDNTAPPCPVCHAEPGAKCQGKTRSVHIERMWLSHGHDPSQFGALREHMTANAAPGTQGGTVPSEPGDDR